MHPIKQFACRAAQGSRQRRRVVRRLSALVDDHFKDPSRRDGRGRRAQDLRAVEKGLRHLKNSTSWQHRPDVDANVQREARALVKTACHGQMPLEELMERASALRGKINKCGKVRNDRKAIEGCDALSLALDTVYSVERLHTVEKLASAGRALGNCAKDNGYGMHDALRERDSDFYLMRRGNEPVAMFQVDLETDQITEFLGRSNAEVDFPHLVLRSLLRRLRLNGDHVDACLQRGVASIFVTRAAKIIKPTYSRGKLHIWQVKRKLVVKEVRQSGQSGRGWSIFRWDGRGWVPSRASSRERLDDLMTRHPDIAVLANKAARGGLRLRKRRSN